LQQIRELQKESQFVNECFEDRALMDLLRLHWIDYFSHSSKRSLSTTQDNDGNTSPVTVTGNPLDKCLFEYDKSIGKHGISKFLSSSSKISSDRKSRYWKTMRRLTVLRNSLFNPAVTENLLSCMRSDNFIAKHTKIEQNLLAVSKSTASERYD
jgi:hypothetical protein